MARSAYATQTVCKKCLNKAKKEVKKTMKKKPEKVSKKTKVENVPEVAVSFRAMYKFEKPTADQIEVGDILYTGKDELIGTVLEVTTQPHLKGPVYVVATPNGKEQIHWSNLAADKAKVKKANEKDMVYGLKKGATTYWIEGNSEFWSGDTKHVSIKTGRVHRAKLLISDIQRNAIILRQLFKQHRKRFSKFEAWGCGKDYDEGIWMLCKIDNDIKVGPIKGMHCDFTIWRKSQEREVHTFDEESAQKPARKPWAMMNCSKCGESIPCYDEPFAKCEKCGAVFAQKASNPVKAQDGQPRDFYNSRYLIDLNKGWESGSNRGGFNPEQEKQKLPIYVVCWNNECDKPMTVCGYPWYICENDHIINVLTGDKWNWKSTDNLYHELLAVLQNIESQYQKLFFPTSKKRADSEADAISTHLTCVGEHAYIQMQPIEPDPNHWGPDKPTPYLPTEPTEEWHHKQSELSHLAGMRFAINIMHQAIENGKRIVSPHEQVAKVDDPEKGYTDKELNKGWKQQGWFSVYEYDAHEYRETLGDETVKKLLLNVNEKISQPQTIKQTELKSKPPQFTKATPTLPNEKWTRYANCRSGSALPLAVRLKMEMEWTQYVGDDKPVQRITKTDKNKQLLTEYIIKTLKESKLFNAEQQAEIVARILKWYWCRSSPLEDAEEDMQHEIAVAKHPLSKKPAAEILKLMQMCHPTEHGEIYTRLDVMHECERRGKQLLKDLKWPTDPNAPYYHAYTGEEETLQQICESYKWVPLNGASHEHAAKLSKATNGEYDSDSTGLSCTDLKFWRKTIEKHPEAKTILREAIRLDKAFYEYSVHKEKLLSSFKKNDSPCEHNVLSIAQWLGIDVAKLEPLDSIPKSDLYMGVWQLIESHQPEPLSKTQRIEMVKQKALPNKPAQSALTDFMEVKKIG